MSSRSKALNGERAPIGSDLRLRIHRAKEDAHERACSVAHLDASEIFHVASGIAARWAFNRAADAKLLEQVLSILNGLYAAAESLQRIEVAP